MPPAAIVDYACMLVPDLWRAVGADAWAPDAASVVEELARLLPK